MAQTRVYEDFQPPYDWACDDRSDTLILPLEGFARNQLKVQITAARMIRVRGERQVEGNKWRRFDIEFQAPQNSDTNDIRAKIERGTLYIRFPKLIPPAVSPHQPSDSTSSAASPDSTSDSSTSSSDANPSAPPPKATPREEPKAEQAIEKKAEAKDETKMEQKEKEPPKEEEEEEEVEGDISEGKILKEEEKSTAPGTEDHYKQVGSRRPSSLSERLSVKAQDYKDAIVALVAEMKKQKDVINKLVVVFVVLLLGLYLKRLVVSSFGGSKTHQEL